MKKAAMHVVCLVAAAAGTAHAQHYPAKPVRFIVPFVKTGQVRALAVTSTKRMDALPDLPTIAESGVTGYESSSWSAIGTTAGTPGEIVARLNSELNQIQKLPDVQKRYAAAGAEVIGGTPGQFAGYLKSELAKSARVVKEAHITAE